jgi:hypothetical protein
MVCSDSPSFIPDFVIDVFFFFLCQSARDLLILLIFSKNHEFVSLIFSIFL